MTFGKFVAAAALTASLALPAWAHGPTPQQAEQKITLAAPPEAVWQILRDPASIADWHPDVASVAMQGEGKGARRTVEFTSGGTVTDGIDRIDDHTLEIRWRLSEPDIEVFPVSYYTNSITVAPAAEGSDVTWKASFFRADTTNEPAEQFSDEAAVTAMKALIDNGLSGLKDAADHGGPS